MAKQSLPRTARPATTCWPSTKPSPRCCRTLASSNKLSHRPEPSCEHHFAGRLRHFLLPTSATVSRAPLRRPSCLRISRPASLRRDTIGAKRIHCSALSPKVVGREDPCVAENRVFTFRRLHEAES